LYFLARSAKYNIRGFQGVVKVSPFTKEVILVILDGVCFKRVERRNVPKVLPRNFAAFAATFGTVSTEMKHTLLDE
jgi:hypothetical protein